MREAAWKDQTEAQGDVESASRRKKRKGKRKRRTRNRRTRRFIDKTCK